MAHARGVSTGDATNRSCPSIMQQMASGQGQDAATSAMVRARAVLDAQTISGYPDSQAISGYPRPGTVNAPHRFDLADEALAAALLGGARSMGSTGGRDGGGGVTLPPRGGGVGAHPTPGVAHNIWGLASLCPSGGQSLPGAGRRLSGTAHQLLPVQQLLPVPAHQLLPVHHAAGMADPLAAGMEVLSRRGFDLSHLQGDAAFDKYHLQGGAAIAKSNPFGMSKGV